MNLANDRHYHLEQVACQFWGVKLKAIVDKSNTRYIVTVVAVTAGMPAILDSIARLVIAIGR